MARSELSQRVAVAAVGIPTAFIIIYLGGWPLGLLLAAIAAGGALELFRMAAQRGVAPFAWTGAVLAAAYVIAAAAGGPIRAAQWSWAVTLVAVLAIGAAAIWRRGVEGRPLAVAAVTVFGALFLGGTLATAVHLRALPGPVPPFDAAHTRWIGIAAVVYPLGLTWISDTCAYFAGRAWGTRKLIPSVSPGKTVQGSIAGVIGTVVVGGLYGAIVFDAWLGLPIGALAGAAGGALVSVVAQVGDLAESLLKREAGVKDSGRLLPGHGGIFDRFDSLLFAFPTAYAYLAWVLPFMVEGLPWR